MQIGQTKPSWLPGARLNIAQCALSNTKVDTTAIVWADEASPTELHCMSLGQLRQESMQFAAALIAQGSSPGMNTPTLLIQ